MGLLPKIFSFVLLLGVLIFVHELGHFLVAKAFKIKVVRFSLGFGPRLFGFRWGETDYRISILPLGGYVKMAGDDPTEVLPPEDRGRGFLEQKPYVRMLVAVAGPAMNLVFPVLAYFLLFAGQTEGVAAHVGQVVPGMPAASAGLLPGDDIVAIDGEQVASFADLKRLVDPAAGRTLRLTVKRGGGEIPLTVTPEPSQEQGPLETVTTGKIGIAPNPAAPEIGIASESSPAYEAGLRSLDRVSSVAGEKVSTLPDALSRLDAASAAGKPFEVVAMRSDGIDVGPVSLPLYQVVHATVTPRPGEALGIESAEMYVDRVVPGTPAAAVGLARGDRLVSAAGQELHSWHDMEKRQTSQADRPFDLVFVHQGQQVSTSIAQAAHTVKDEIRGRDVISYTFGARGGVPSLPAPMVKLPFRPLLAARESVVSAWELTRVMVKAVGMLFTGQVAFSNVGGPIQIYDITTKAAEQGWEAFLAIMAAISINLGLMNLLPVPVLDGGHMLQAGIEMVRRKPLSLRFREVANLVGLALLVTLMVFAFKNDVVRFFLSGGS